VDGYGAGTDVQQDDKLFSGLTKNETAIAKYMYMKAHPVISVI
jgi:hypothetical protein